MKHLMVSAIALIAGLSSANAADPYSYKDTPTTVIPAIPGPSGLYVELGVGYGFSQSNVASIVTLSSTGTEFEARLGYDKKVVGNWGLGAFVEAGNGFDVNGKLANLTFSNAWNWGVGGKAFYDHGGGQVYVIGAYSHSDVSFASLTTGHDGVKYGGGITLKVLGNAYVGLEFTQTKWDGAVFGGLSDKQTDNRAMVRFGVSAN